MDQEKYIQFVKLVKSVSRDMTNEQRAFTGKILLQTQTVPGGSGTLTSRKCDALSELKGMTGCFQAKSVIDEMISSYLYYEIVASRTHIRKHRPYCHAMFTGNSGTAKTTCARLYSHILSDRGILNSKYAELSRSQICGAYLGYTAKIVKKIFKENKGGLIFIDEAYALTEEGNGDLYGAEAINELIVGLENNPDTMVIFAGYEEQMKTFIESNPGLCSRIPFSVHFPDYTTSELLDISCKIAKNNGFSISEGAKAQLKVYYERLQKKNNFGNGRCCRNVIERAIRRKGIQMGVLEADDLSAYCDVNKYSDEKLLTLDEACFTFVNESVPMESGNKIGFN